MKKITTVLTLGLLLSFIVSCTTTKLAYKNKMDFDNDVIKLKNPHYQKRVNTNGKITGWSSIITGMVSTFFLGESLDLIKFKNKEDGSYEKKYGVNGLAWSIPIGIIGYLIYDGIYDSNTKDISITKSQIDRWVSDFDKSYKYVESQKNYSNNYISDLTLIPYSSESGYKINNFENLRLFTKAFPASKKSSKVFKDATNILKYRDFNKLVSLSKSENNIELKYIIRELIAKENNLDSLFAIYDKYPNHKDEVAKKAYNYVSTVDEFKSFKMTFENNNLNNAIFDNIYNNFSRNELKNLITLFPKAENVKKAQKMFYEKSETIEEYFEAQELYSINDLTVYEDVSKFILSNYTFIKFDMVKKYFSKFEKYHKYNKDIFLNYSKSLALIELQDFYTFLEKNKMLHKNKGISKKDIKFFIANIYLKKCSTLNNYIQLEKKVPQYKTLIRDYCLTNHSFEYYEIFEYSKIISSKTNKKKLNLALEKVLNNNIDRCKKMYEYANLESDFSDLKSNLPNYFQKTVKNYVNEIEEILSTKAANSIYRFDDANNFTSSSWPYIKLVLTSESNNANHYLEDVLKIVKNHNWSSWVASYGVRDPEIYGATSEKLVIVAKWLRSDFNAATSLGTNAFNKWGKWVNDDVEKLNEKIGGVLRFELYPLGQGRSNYSNSSSSYSNNSSKTTKSTSIQIPELKHYSKGWGDPERWKFSYKGKTNGVKNWDKGNKPYGIYGGTNFLMNYNTFEKALIGAFEEVGYKGSEYILDGQTYKLNR